MGGDTASRNFAPILKIIFLRLWTSIQPRQVTGQGFVGAQEGIPGNFDIKGDS